MKVSVHALFSRNNKIGSRIISAGTKYLEPYVSNSPSHVALLVNCRWVHEATGCSGVRVISLDKWLEINTEVDRFFLGIKEYSEVADKFREIQTKKYDYPGVLFVALAILLNRMGMPMPTHNPVESKNKFFCCEVLGYLTGHYYYGMSAPIQILAQVRRLTDE